MTNPHDAYDQTMNVMRKLAEQMSQQDKFRFLQGAAVALGFYISRAGWLTVHGGERILFDEETGTVKYPDAH